ncbi:MAG TPA: pilus assembly protein TadG-related protein [Candidatus Eisenbacteria bacterium]|nr:pilus assembly protein TadG-related protein [Candidatus Eisenbacteria bacterium]
MKPPQAVRNNERGVVIIWSAFFMIMMLGFVALGIDVAKLMATRTELQNAADAAALAGASALNLQTGKLRPDTALFRAQATSARNKAFVQAGESVTLLASDVSVDVNQNLCTVTVRRDPTSDGSMVTHIAQVLGITNLQVKATATAKAERTCSQCEKLVPLGSYPPQGQQNFVVGQMYVLKQASPGGVNGNYQAVSFPECAEGPCAGMSSTGANTYRCLLENGYSCCITIGQTIQTQPGNMAGPTRTGVQNRWDSDTDRRTNINYPEYAGNGARVVNIPIITPMGNGRSDVTVTGLAAFFLHERPTGNGEIRGEFIHEVVPGTGGNCNSTVFTIRLVQ